VSQRRGGGKKKSVNCELSRSDAGGKRQHQQKKTNQKKTNPKKAPKKKKNKKKKHTKKKKDPKNNMYLG